MNKFLRCIMLIDDDEDDNFLHQHEVRMFCPDITIIVMESAKEALQYLTSTPVTDAAYPDLFFLDINMPGMSGWDFMAKYSMLDQPGQSEVICIMLSTSNYYMDQEKAKA